MRKKIKSITPKIAKQILKKAGVFVQEGEDLAASPRYASQIRAARLRLMQSLPECVSCVEAAFNRGDFAIFRSWVRPLPDGKFLLSGGAVTLQRLGRGDLVERVIQWVRLFPRRDPPPKELARLMAQASRRVKVRHSSGRKQ
jgi:hypothetical protein